MPLHIAPPSTPTQIEIDEVPIQAAIESVAKAQKDFSLSLKARAMSATVLNEVLQGTQRYLGMDFEIWEEFDCEAYTSRRDSLGNAHRVQGTLDIVGINHSLKTLDIIDWKRVGRLDQVKVLKYANSWQPVTYAEYMRQVYPDYAIKFAFRFYVASDQAFQDVRFELPEHELEGRLAELKEIEKAVESQNTTGVWPRHSGSCNDYNRLCVFNAVCWKEIGKPIHINHPQLSQSLYSLHNQCPQKYARTMLQCETQSKDYHDLGGSELPAVLGSMFHAGMEVVYEQAREIKVLKS